MIVESLLLGFSSDHVAVLIEHGEGVPVLEDAKRTGHPLRIGQNGEVIVELKYIRHMNGSQIAT